MFFTSQGLVAIFGFRNLKGFPRDVVKVVVFVVGHCLVVSSTEILNPTRVVFSFVMTGYVVGHDVDDHLHVLGLRPGNQPFKLFHAAGDIYCKVWVDLVVVPHCIGGSCTAFDHVRIVRLDPNFRKIADYSVMWYAGIPDMGYPQLFDFCQSSIRKVVKLAHPILFLGTPGNVTGVRIAKKSSEYLINDNFLGRHGLGFCSFGSLAGK